MNQHYTMSQGRHSQEAMSTTLQINHLSYLDAGNYSCVVNSSNAMDLGSNTIQARSIVELKLIGMTILYFQTQVTCVIITY